MSRLISISQTPSEGYAEPVTVDEVKLFLRVDFTDDDDIITALITAARMKCEKVLGLVLVDTDIKALYRADYSEPWQGWGGYPASTKPRTYEIFYGPVIDESGVPAFDGLPDDAEIKGFGKDVWIETYADELAITYSSGWGTTGVPDALKLAVKMQVAWDYEHRGDEAYNGKIAPEAMAMLRPFSVNLSDVLL